jgi:two-component system NtrC family sensor kinase
MHDRLAKYVTQFAPRAPLGVVLAGADLVVIYVNDHATKLVGIAVGERLQSFCEANVEELLRGRETVAQEEFWRRGDERVACDGTYIPLRDAQDRPEGLLILLQESLQRRAQEHALLQSERFSALDLVVRGFSHELNNPLTVILGFAELLLKKPLEPDVRTRVATISEKADRCRKIVENLSRFSRANRSAVTEVQVNEVLEEIMSLCAYQMQMDQIEVTVELGPELPLLPLQKQELQGVFLAILNNAHQALGRVWDRPRHLWVQSRLGPEYILITFRDNGPGLAPEVQHRVFDPFFTTRGVGEGMGLGLSVAYGVVRENGGRIWLDSSGPEGSTFMVELPLPR